MFKKVFRVALISLLALAVAFGAIITARSTQGHAASHAIPHAASINKIVIDPNTLTSQKIQFMQKLQDSGLLKEFALNNGHITLKSPLSILQAKYQLSVSETQMVQAMHTFDQQRQVSSASSTHPVPQISVNGTVLYFTNDDVHIFLLAAASAGPEAMIAALDAVATLFAGPIGTTIGTILGIIGVASLANFCYLVLQASADNKGVYMGIAWTPWPNYTQGEW